MVKDIKLVRDQNMKTNSYTLALTPKIQEAEDVTEKVKKNKKKLST